MEMEVKSRKKSVNKRKFRSAPDLPVENFRKAPDMFFVSPEEIRKYKRKIEEKKKQEQKKIKVKKSKAVGKETAKVLIERIKPDEEDIKKNPQDYQWLIKKNIIKLMGTALKAKKDQAKKKGAQKKKTKGSNTDDIILQTAKSESAKARKPEQTRKRVNTAIVKTESVKEQAPRQRRIAQSAKPEPLKEHNPRQRIPAAAILHQRATTAPITVQRAKPETGAKNRFGVQKLKNLFNVLKPVPDLQRQVDEKKLSVMFSRELHDRAQAEQKDEEPKRAPKKKNKIKNDRPKTKTNKILPVVEVQSATKRPEKKKRKQPQQQKLVYTVTT